jgi:hypothetical protein
VYEVTLDTSHKLKKRKLNELEPGSASPAKLFQAHEAKLLNRAMQREDNQRRSRRDELQQEKQSGHSTMETTPIPDFFEEERTVEQEGQDLLSVFEGEESDAEPAEGKLNDVQSRPGC